MGCLATHIAWHHPATESFSDDAGVLWLTRMAGLNPATSAVVLEWDRAGAGDWQLRTRLSMACRQELAAREEEGPAEYDEADCELQTC